MKIPKPTLPSLLPQHDSFLPALKGGKKKKATKPQQQINQTAMSCIFLRCYLQELLLGNSSLLSLSASSAFPVSHVSLSATQQLYSLQAVPLQEAEHLLQSLLCCCVFRRVSKVPKKSENTEENKML